MNRILYSVSLAFTAGAFGGLVNRLAIWIFGITGITDFFGVALKPSLNETFLYPGIVWGGLWGVLFLLPFMKKSVLARGLIYGFFPSLVMLFVVFPFWMGKGIMGFELGKFTPILVFVFNSFWGIAAVWWFKRAREFKEG